MAILGSNNDYWKAILITSGGTPLPGDTERDLASRVLKLGANTGVSDDTLRDLARKIVGSPFKSGESMNDVLRRFYLLKVGYNAPPGSSDNDLLRSIANAGFAVATPADGDWNLADNGEGVTQVIILSGVNPSGSDGFRSRWTDDETPASNGQSSSTTDAGATETDNFAVGETVHYQIAWFLSGVQVSDWSNIQSLTLG